MLTGHFPHLPEEGTTVTFSREKALSREDMAFMSWEHPMIVEAMDMVHSTELGNAALGTIQLKGIAPGTLLLECLFTVNCVSPKSLQIERFLPLSPMRLLVDARGKDLATLLPHKRLNSLVERVGKSTALAIIKQVRSEVETKMSMATAMAESQLGEILQAGEEKMKSVLGEELQRLKTLRLVNPSIRAEEVEHLEYTMEESAVHIRHANLQLQALRLIITA
jgi:ATP-dependent helicase HepA